MVTLTENALQVLEYRYLRKNEKGEVIESPRALFERVANAVAAAEDKWDSKAKDATAAAFFDVLSNLLFLPNSPTLMNAGTGLNQLSACFVLPVEDSLEKIFDTLRLAMLIQQSGGGTGFNFSHLRPYGATIGSTGGISSGPLSFMKTFDAATANIRSGGKRRGANMGILNIDHPDIAAFIIMKNREHALPNFNISAGISDAFMHAVAQNGKWELKDPCSGAVVQEVPARRLWDAIVWQAWETGDPGVVFLDTINAKQPTPACGRIEATNPCGEVPLLPYESCILGSIDLAKFVKQQSDGPSVDWPALERVIAIAVRFLDNVIEVNNYPDALFSAAAMANRKIGLGVMGWADMLIKLQIPYDTDNAVELAEKVMGFIEEKSLQASTELAAVRGPFPNWEKSIYYPHQRVRNATRTSIAPTGSISIIAGTSASIEPLFGLAYQWRHALGGTVLDTVHPLFLEYLEQTHTDNWEVIRQLLKEGIATHINAIPEAAKALFKTATDISPAWHLRHQLAFQQHTDNAVSKTINLPACATVAEVEQVFQTAWREKAKGITVFRNNTGNAQVLQQGIAGREQACRS